MQVLGKHKTAAFVTVLLVATVLIALFIFQNAPKPTQTPNPALSPTPTSSTAFIQTPIPTSASTVAPTQTPTLAPTSFPLPETTLNPTPVPIILHPGEVLQYQGQNLSPIVDVYQNAIAGTQHVDQTTYRLTINGLVNKTLEYTYNEVVSHQKYQKVVTIYCVEGWNAKILWEGILIKDLLNESGIAPEAQAVTFYAADGYTTSLPLDYLLPNDIMIAYKMNNVTLTAETGWPFMLVAQSQYGYKWIKWVTQIEVSNDPNYLGYWESRGYPNDASINP